MTLPDNIDDREFQKFEEVDTDKVAVRVTLDGGDIEIGAVEIKDGNSDQRATVDSNGALQVLDQAVAGLITFAYNATQVTSYDSFDNPLEVLYWNGGVGGTLVGTITLTYDSEGRFLTATRS